MAANSARTLIIKTPIIQYKTYFFQHLHPLLPLVGPGCSQIQALVVEQTQAKGQSVLTQARLQVRANSLAFNIHTLVQHCTIQGDHPILWGEAGVKGEEGRVREREVGERERERGRERRERRVREREGKKRERKKSEGGEEKVKMYV